MSKARDEYYKAVNDENTNIADISFLAVTYLSELEYELKEVGKYNRGLAEEIREKDRKILELTTSREGDMIYWLANNNFFYKCPRIRNSIRNIQCKVCGHNWFCTVEQKDGNKHCAWCCKKVGKYPRMRRRIVK